MGKPAEFQAEYIVVKNVICELSAPSPYGGVRRSLGIGRVVWLNGELHPSDVATPVTAYVEPIGIVNLDPHCLHPCRPESSRGTAQAR